jgi:hypothetical protein
VEDEERAVVMGPRDLEAVAEVKSTILISSLRYALLWYIIIIAAI